MMILQSKSETLDPDFREMSKYIWSQDLIVFDHKSKIISYKDARLRRLIFCHFPLVDRSVIGFRPWPFRTVFTELPRVKANHQTHWSPKIKISKIRSLLYLYKDDQKKEF